MKMPFFELGTGQRCHPPRGRWPGPAGFRDQGFHKPEPIKLGCKVRWALAPTAVGMAPPITLDFRGPLQPPPRYLAAFMPVIDENSTFRQGWDVFMVLLIIATCVVIPFQLAFRHVVLPFGSALVYGIDFFFWLDILFNFFTSYRRPGEKITDVRLTTRHYLRGYFALDLIATLPLDAFFLGQEHLAIVGLPLVLVLRQFRLLRLVKLFVIFKRWERRAWGKAGYLRLALLLILFLILIHWIACVWFLAPYLADFPENSWVTAEGIAKEDLPTQYIRSLYWVVTTVSTVGYGDVLPANDYEYLFAAGVMLLGAFMYAFIIGNIANLVRNLDAERARYFQRVEAIGNYLHERRIPTRLNEQVRDYYDYLWAHHRGLREASYLEELPPPFRLELLVHLTQDLLATVPLFSYCTPPLRNALLLALQAYTYAPGVRIAAAGEAGREIFFLSHGKAAILSEDGGEHFGILENGDYFGNLSLVLGEKRTACVQALTYCEVLVLSKKAYYQIRREYPAFQEILKQIAATHTERVAALILQGVVL